MHTAGTDETLEGREDDMKPLLISLGKVLNAAKPEHTSAHDDAPSKGGCEHHSCHFNAINPTARLALTIVSGWLAANSISTDAFERQQPRHKCSFKDRQEERERAGALMTVLGCISQAREAAEW